MLLDIKILKNKHNQEKMQRNSIFTKFLFFFLISIFLSNFLGCNWFEPDLFDKPPSPSNLQAQDLKSLQAEAIEGKFQVTVTWSDVPGASYYNLYYSINGEKEEKVIVENAIKISNITSPYIHKDLSAYIYCYVVTSVKEGRQSLASNQICVDFRVLIWDQGFWDQGFWGSK
jgi:hypothetical protein